MDNCAKGSKWYLPDGVSALCALSGAKGLPTLFCTQHVSRQMLQHTAMVLEVFKSWSILNLDNFVEHSALKQNDGNGSFSATHRTVHNGHCDLKGPCKQCYIISAAGYIKLLYATAGLRRFSPKWCILQSISFICFLISVGGCVGSIAQIVIDTEDYTPFVTKYWAAGLQTCINRQKK